jgi:Predicted methyltransferase regulatory domain
MSYQSADGYGDEMEFSQDYDAAFNPLRIQYILTYLGVESTKVGVACELAFGQGVSLNTHAAAGLTQWYGTDFNSQHLVTASEIAKTFDNHPQLYGQVFEEFCHRSDLPDFDLIVVPSVWPVVSEKNCQIITDFIKKKLKLGGVAYIDYRTQFDTLSKYPLHDLAVQYGRRIDISNPDAKSRVKEVLQFTDQLMQFKSKFWTENPSSKNFFEIVKARPVDQIYHEFFNEHFHLTSFGEMANRLSSAQLEFAGSAIYYNNLLSSCLPKEQASFLQTISDPIFKQVVFDFLKYNVHREDYWVKGLKRMPASTRAQALRSYRFIRIQPLNQLSFTKLNWVNLESTFFKKLINTFSGFEFVNLQMVEDLFRGEEDISFDMLAEGLFILCGAGIIGVTQSESNIDQVRSNTKKLNYHLLSLAKSRNLEVCFSSPVTGGGINVSHLHQLFLLALTERENILKEGASALAIFAWECLNVNNQKLIKGGRVLQSAEENIDGLMQHAKKFTHDYLPLYRGLQII